ncbi:MAG TPA: hypothetical protein VEC59_07620 [Steroidobacteraceae bacterium]|nr:hypothetical protein [Steroidobacteraceae bacterium]
MEPLPELPVEDPADGAASAAKAHSGSEAAGQTPAKADTESTQTLLKPEFLLADDEPTIPGVAEADTPEAPQVLEDIDPDAPLTLESAHEVDKMLSAPPPPASPAGHGPSLRAALAEDELTLLPDSGPSARSTAAPATPASAPAPKLASASAPPATRSAEAGPAAAPAMVPLARRASLTAAAQKLAAAAAAPPQEAVKPPKPVAPAAPVAPARPRVVPTAPAASVTPIAKKPASAPAAAPASAATPEAPPAPAVPPPAEAPSLASWANARAAAAASAKATANAPARSSPPAAKPAPQAHAEKPRAASARPAPPPVAPAAPAGSATAATSTGFPARGMDRDFIARNQVVERYLSGKLPIKAATDFERYCKEHPQLLDELGLPERVNAGVRLLEASGKPEPWQEAPKPIWQQPAAILGTAGLAVVLALVLAIVAAGSAGKTHKILELQRQVTDRTLDAATSTRVIRLLPNRSGASGTPAIVIGGGAAQLVDFRIDESRSPYKDFRITIDRLDQGRVMVIDNLAKDSNGHLRVQINSSAFGPGNYLLTIEGLTMRLEPQPDSWVTIGIAQR